MFYFLFLALLCATSTYCQEVSKRASSAPSAPLQKRTSFLPPLKNQHKPSPQELRQACSEIDDAIILHDLITLNELLRRYPLLINARDTEDYNTTFLMQAALQGKTKVCKLLLEHGADITLQDDDGITAALHAAKEHPNEDALFDLLYTYGAENVNGVRAKNGISVESYLKIRGWVTHHVCKTNHWNP